MPAALYSVKAARRWWLRLRHSLRGGSLVLAGLLVILLSAPVAQAGHVQVTGLVVPSETCSSGFEVEGYDAWCVVGVYNGDTEETVYYYDHDGRYGDGSSPPPEPGSSPAPPVASNWNQLTSGVAG